jgi:hypothetical protein
MSTGSAAAGTSTSDAGKEDVGERAYTYGRFQRGAAYAFIGGAVLVAGVAVWGVFNGSDQSTTLPLLVAVIAINAFQTVPNLLSTVRLSDEALRIERPLSEAEEVRYGDVGRVFLGGAAVEVYVAPDAPSYAPGRSAADLRVSRDIEDAEDFIRHLAHRLPEKAAVENPSGEFADLRRPGA